MSVEGCVFLYVCTVLGIFKFSPIFHIRKSCKESVSKCNQLVEEQINSFSFVMEYKLGCQTTKDSKPFITVLYDC